MPPNTDKRPAVVLILVWLRAYATRFTNPKGRPLVLKPGPNPITDDMVPIVEKHRAAIERLEAAGHLRLEQPPAPASSTRPLSTPRPTPAPPPPPAPPSEADDVDEDDDSADDHGDEPPASAGPARPWNEGSSYDELKAAATSRGIEYPGNVSKARLLELLEAHDDAALLEAASKDDDGA